MFIHFLHLAIEFDLHRCKYIHVELLHTYEITHLYTVARLMYMYMYIYTDTSMFVLAQPPALQLANLQWSGVPTGHGARSIRQASWPSLQPSPSTTSSWPKMSLVHGLIYECLCPLLDHQPGDFELGNCHALEHSRLCPSLPPCPIEESFTRTNEVKG